MKIRIQLAQGQQVAFVRTGRRFTADSEGCVEVEEFSQDHYDLLSQGGAIFAAAALVGGRRRGPGTPPAPAPRPPVTDPEVPSPPAPPVEPPVPPETDGGVVTDPEPAPGDNMPGPFDPVPPPADV